MISVDLPKTVMCGSMIQADPGSRSTGSDPGIHFRDPRACLHTTNSKVSIRIPDRDLIKLHNDVYDTTTI